MNKQLTEEEIDRELSYLKKIGVIKESLIEYIRKQAIGSRHRPLELLIDLNLSERDTPHEDFRH